MYVCAVLAIGCLVVHRQEINQWVSLFVDFFCRGSWQTARRKGRVLLAIEQKRERLGGVKYIVDVVGCVLFVAPPEYTYLWMSVVAVFCCFQVVGCSKY